MPSLQPTKIDKISVPVATTWLVSSCMEAKGKQDLWVRQKPEVLNALREQAIIQSVESSNRIEGVTVDAHRLRPIVLGKTKPRDRSEEELAGYRSALNWIFSRKRPVPIEPSTILHLHALAQGGTSGDAGRWKQRDNEIIEFLPSGERKIRFLPISAAKTPKAIQQLCLAYHDVSGIEKVPILITIATFIFDFLCVHPFRDGNGRVSRLLTTLLLQQTGFAVGRYVSLEKLIEERKEDYYDILASCSQGWHEGQNEIIPWWNYFLSILKQAYDSFAARVESATSHRHGKSELVTQAIQSAIGPFTLSEIQQVCPSVSGQLIKKILNQMKHNGELQLKGRGRSALWEKQR